MTPEDREAEESTFGLFPNLGVIPAELLTTCDQAPFRSCTVCEADLERSVAFEIQKVFRGTQCVFEMAVCFACAEKLIEEYSEESKKVLLACHMGEESREPEAAPSCEFCWEARSAMDRFTAIGLCRKDYLVHPVVYICEACSEQLQERLSRQTRDTFDRFVRDHFPGVPTDLEVPSVGSLI